MDKTCSVADCGKAQYQNRPWCASHAMRRHRYGDPLAGPPAKPRQDITGKRFGALVALSREPGSRWLCRCDCGNQKSVLIGDLNRGSTTTCGERPTHPRKALVTYAGAHDRVAAAKGRAADHRCIDCTEPAQHWSYDHQDPDELIEALPVQRGRYIYDVAYSVDPEHYDPRCIRCHRAYDMGRKDAHAVA